MIEIEHKLISEELFTEHFVCDLSACKGGCCEEGDAGAPLTEEEKDEIENAFPAVEHLLSKEAKAVIDKQGKFVHHPHVGWVTPTVGDGICVYGTVKKNGCISCAFQEMYKAEKMDWEKPISCHLFPIKIAKTAVNELINFEPRPTLCKAGCTLGEKTKVKVYQFLKNPLIRKYGVSFYLSLQAVDREYFTMRDKP